MEFYISQLIHYACAFSLYSDFLQRHHILCTNKNVDIKLLNRASLPSRLILSFKTFFRKISTPC
jgi:hypothetical protein